MTTATKETFAFQTEIKQLLHLMINSLYSNKEIFLRELVSNAADACDKLRFLAIEHPELQGTDSELAVFITFDKKAKTITIRDNGIGMSRAEAIDHLGTIAKSGSKEFFSALTGEQAKDRELIGQFGVGFYSAFMVADKVDVFSRRANLPENEGIRWTSGGEGDYEVETISKKDRGTEIVLHMKKDSSEFVDEARIRHIVTKYCDHINLPVMMLKTDIENPDDKKDEKDVTPPQFEAINKATALWTLPKKDISAEQYKEFYKYIAHDYTDPLAWSHNRVEGKQEYTSLLFVPARAPFDLFDPQQKMHGLKLYIQKVFIMDDVTYFLPRYLRFIRGVVDSKDLPLNVSREILQHSVLVDKIKAASTKKIIAMFNTIAEKPEEYQKFWDQFGKVIKEGPIEDAENKDALAKLLRFASTHNNSAVQNVSLAEYVARMPQEQDKIYYITADSYLTAKHSPQLEVFTKKSVEVLLLSDHIDEWVVNSLPEFEGKKLQSVSKGDLDLGKLADEDTKKQQEQLDKDYADLITRVKKVLENKVSDVRLTYRLTTSPSCIVSDDSGMGLQMQRMLEAAGHKMPAAKPIFELNPEHKLVQKLNGVTDEEKFSEWSHVLYDEALLAEGGSLEDPAQFVQRLNKLLVELS
jgi:molecular chaperone HtpG